MMRKFFLSAWLLMAAQMAGAQVSFGESTRFNDGWLFLLGDDAEASQPAYDDSHWRRLTLPHDWSVEAPMSPQLYSCTGYLPGGIGWYRKHFRLDEGLMMKDEPLHSDVRSSHIPHPSSLILHPSSSFIYFEAVYNRSEVYLNGHLLGTRPNGYASFLYDMTPYLNKAGEDNVLAVRVDHSRQADSRWYTGSGIYRDVWLVRAPEVHLAQWGSAWRVKSLSKSKAVVEVDIETAGTPLSQLSSLISHPSSLISHPSSLLQADVIIRDASGRTVATTTTAIGCPAKKTVTLTIRNPHRWSLCDTYLYNIETRLSKGEEKVSTPLPMGEGVGERLLLDRCKMRMGLRTLTFSPDRGFALNGEWMKVKGVCLHHDAGVLGAAVPREVWQLRLQELKKVGVNAIRMSHNPQAPMLYDLCDELGFLVMDEASDEWEFPKRKWLEGWNRGTPGYEGSADFFEGWIERDVADMVRRDRNHPSVFLWSIGNEVDYPNDPYSHPILDGDGKDFTQPMYGGYKPDQPNAERIGKIAKRLATVVRAIDPSRAVTGALAGVVMSNQTEYPEAVDVVGYNYTESRYGEDHARYPKRVIYGSENRHDYPSWLAVKDNDHIFGQFLWTGADYLGESGPWPARGSTAGLVDLASQRKPNGWYRASLWSTDPVCYIGTYPLRNAQPQRGSHGQQMRTPHNFVSTYATDTWNYREGQPVRVVCYSNQPDVRLTLNGQPVGGEATLDTATNVRYWDIDFHPGILRAEVPSPQPSPTEEGAVARVVPSSGEEGLGVVAYEIRTSGLPYALLITEKKLSESAHIQAEDRSDGTVSILLIEVIDEQGTPVRLADNMITCTVLGPAHLLGLENGDINDTTYQPPLQGARQRGVGQRGASRRAFQGRLTAYIRSDYSDSSENSEYSNHSEHSEYSDYSASPSRPAFRVRVSSPLLQDAEIELPLPQTNGPSHP